MFRPSLYTPSPTGLLGEEHSASSSGPSTSRRRVSRGNPSRFLSPFGIGWRFFILGPLLSLAAACSGDGESALPGGPGGGAGGRPASGASPGEGPAAPEVWRLSDAPILEIGVREGEEAYQLFRVGGSVRLTDGRIVVANTGSRELRVFGPDGVFQATIGRDGEGPGEFRWPSRIRMLGPDTILVWDQSLQLVSLFGLDGHFLAMAPLRPTSENLFPGDEWLMVRNWIDSPVAPRDRGPIRQGVEALPPVDSVATLRYVKVTKEGWLWVSSTRPPADSAIDWRVYDLSGHQVAEVRTPPRFQPHEIGPDYVLGRYLDPLDVNLVRLYALDRGSSGIRPPDGFHPSVDMGGFSGAVDAGQTPEPVSEEVLANMRSILKNLASREEIHYSREMTYTTDLDALEVTLRGEAAETLEIGIPFAGTEGWMVTMRHRPTGRMCAMVYGYFVPMGWMAGQVICP